MIEYQLPTFYEVYFYSKISLQVISDLLYFHFEGRFSSRKCCVVCRRQKRRDEENYCRFEI